MQEAETFCAVPRKRAHPDASGAVASSAQKGGGVFFLRLSAPIPDLARPASAANETADPASGTAKRPSDFPDKPTSEIFQLANGPVAKRTSPQIHCDSGRKRIPRTLSLEGPVCGSPEGSPQTPPPSPGQNLKATGLPNSPEGPPCPLKPTNRGNGQADHRWKVGGAGACRNFRSFGCRCRTASAAGAERSRPLRGNPVPDCRPITSRRRRPKPPVPSIQASCLRDPEIPDTRANPERFGWTRSQKAPEGIFSRIWPPPPEDDRG